MAQAPKAGPAKADPPALIFDHSLLGVATRPAPAAAGVEEDDEEEDLDAAEDERFVPPFAARLESVVRAIDGVDSDPAVRAAAIRAANQLTKIAKRPALDLTPVATPLNEVSTKTGLVQTALEEMKGKLGGPVELGDNSLKALERIATALEAKPTGPSSQGTALATLAFGAFGGLGKTSEGYWIARAGFKNLSHVATTDAKMFVEAMVAARDKYPELHASALVRDTTEDDLRQVHAAAQLAVQAIAERSGGAPPP